MFVTATLRLEGFVAAVITTGVRVVGHLELVCLFCCGWGVGRGCYGLFVGCYGWRGGTIVCFVT